MKTTLLTMFLVQAVLVSSASGKKDAIGGVRRAKLKQVATALAAADAGALRAALSSASQAMSQKEAAALLATISQSWGELSKLEEVPQEEQPIFDKGDMRVVAHWGKMPTESGEWLIFRTAGKKNTFLRIGLLFGKGDEHAGQFLACEFPAPEQSRPNKSDADDSQ